MLYNIPVSELAAALRQVRGVGADVSTEAGSGQATTVNESYSWPLGGTVSMVDSNVPLLQTLEGRCAAVLTRKVSGQKITVTSRRVIPSVLYHYQSNGLSLAPYFSSFS